MSNAGEGGIKPAGESKPLGAPRGKRPRIRVGCVDQLGACCCLRYGGTVPGNEPGTAKFCCPEVDTLNVWLAEIVDE